MNEEMFIYIVLPCEVSPCQNGGACVNEENGNFKCNCTTGYTGLVCTKKGNCLHKNITTTNLLIQCLFVCIFTKTWDES